MRIFEAFSLVAKTSKGRVLGRAMGEFDSDWEAIDRLQAAVDAANAQWEDVDMVWLMDSANREILRMPRARAEKAVEDEIEYEPPASEEILTQPQVAPAQSATVRSYPQAQPARPMRPQAPVWDGTQYGYAPQPTQDPMSMLGGAMQVVQQAATLGKVNDPRVADLAKEVTELRALNRKLVEKQANAAEEEALVRKKKIGAAYDEGFADGKRAGIREAKQGGDAAEAAKAWMPVISSALPAFAAVAQELRRPPPPVAAPTQVFHVEPPTRRAIEEMVRHSSPMEWAAVVEQQTIAAMGEEAGKQALSQAFKAMADAVNIMGDSPWGHWLDADERAKLQEGAVLLKSFAADVDIG